VNVQHWFVFNITTSLGYDVPRAILTATVVLLLGSRVLAALRRTSRIAAFDATATFAPHTPSEPARALDPEPSP
ncbi:MAG: ECF transporter S component, partial [Actinomycetota bacterium]|nr:ECF transporter S component [Actinomycetota bacterium]